ncbi:MAG TPA: carbonate dehydratase [Gammaproteobacteria bacterium]|nr:carbonate dehydratase [Gammaproteobacteria bacterium]
MVKKTNDAHDELKQLFQNNREWAQKETDADPQFFARLAGQQAPEYLWIGCSDSRVPANQIVGLLPGELFVHRNIANVVIHTDLNCLSVMQYAVEVLKVKHIIVTGHYNCGGVQAAMQNQQFGLVDNWLRNIRDLYHASADELAQLSNDQEKLNRLCELNVKAQVNNVCHTQIVQNAWARNQELTVHGWIYSLENGLLKDLGVTVNSIEQVHKIYHVAP